MKQLLEEKQRNSYGEKKDREYAVMMFFVPMYQRIKTDNQGKKNHKEFKIRVVDYVNAKKRET